MSSGPQTTEPDVLPPELLAHRLSRQQLEPDPGRVITRLFLPGSELPGTPSRIGAVLTRVLALSEDAVEAETARVTASFASRHQQLPAVLTANAAIAAAHIPAGMVLSPERTVLLGACFTAEYAVEAAALCNPSAVAHPDQSGLDPGQLRVAVSLRGIGEGHLSSIGFVTAVIGPGPTWVFDPRPTPVIAATTTATPWDRDQLERAVRAEGPADELAVAVLQVLPDPVSAADLEHTLEGLPIGLRQHRAGRAAADLLRRLVSSTYTATFPPGTALGQQVLLPAVPEESHGLEDARFVQFTDTTGGRGVPGYLHRLRRRADQPPPAHQPGPGHLHRAPTHRARRP